MRTLDGEVILHLAALLIFMLTLLFVNIIIYVNRTQRYIQWLFHITSFFLLCTLGTQFMIEAIIEMEMERTFIIIRNALFIPDMLMISVLVCYLLLIKEKKGVLTVYPPMHNLLEQMDDAVAIFDAEGVAIRVNDKNGCLSFLKEPLETIGQLVYGIPEELQSDRNHSFSFEKTDPDTGAALQVLVSPMISEAGQLIGHSAVIHDVTDYHRLFAMLEEKNKYLKESNEKLHREVELLGLLESEKQRFGLITRIQEVLVIQVERAIASIHSMERDYQMGRQPDREELMLLSEELNKVYKEVRLVVRSISIKEEPVVD